MTERSPDSPKSSEAATPPEGHTQEKPAPDEAGKPGAPGHVDDSVARHDPATHVDAHATVSDEDHHGESRLEAIDWAAWSYALAGVAVGLLVVAVLWLKTG